MATESQVDKCANIGDVNVDVDVDVDVNKDSKIDLNDPIAARVYENILACRKEKIRSSLGRKTNVVYPISAFNLANPTIKRDGSPPLKRVKVYKFNW